METRGKKNKTCSNVPITVNVTTFLSKGGVHVPLWGSGRSLLAIARVRWLGSISWLRTIGLGSSWSSGSSRGAFESTGSITLGRLAVVMRGGLGGRISSYRHMNVKECAGLSFITLINIKIIKDHFQSGTKTQHLTCTTPDRPDSANLA